MLYVGNVLARYSKGVRIVLLREVVARRMAVLMGCASGAVCILVQDCRTRFLRRRYVGGRDVSICSAAVAVVRKIPSIAFMAVLWAGSSLTVVFCWCGGVLPLKGLCQTIAA